MVGETEAGVGGMRILRLALLLFIACMVMPCAALGEVRAYLFHSEGCDHCQVVTDEIIPEVQGVFPLVVKELEVAEGANNLLLDAVLAAYGLEGADVPVMLLGEEILLGEEDIRGHLLDMVVELEGGGGSDWPRLPEVEASAEPLGLDAPAGVAYFYKTSCPRCDRTAVSLGLLAEANPSVEIRKFDAASVENGKLLERYGSAYGVPAGERLVTPAVFVGDAYFVGEPPSAARLAAAVKAAAAAKSLQPWERLGAGDGGEGILARYREFGMAAVALAGLIDGVNPCAFATIVFLLSFLAYAGRSRKEIMAVGVSFTLAVFLTYLAFGLGLFALIGSAGLVFDAARVLYVLAGIMSLVLAGYSFYDFVLCLKGRARDTKLQLPKSVKRSIHKSIRLRLGAGATVAAGFVTGIVVSAMELACTGQVYLPTIVFVAGLPGERGGALGYLVVYNLAFILPLVAVFGLAWKGVGAAQVEKFFRSNMALSKLALAILFLGLGTIMLSAV